MAAAKSGKDTVDTSSWVTRNMAADLLEVSHTTIRGMEGKILHPRRGRRSLPNGGYREIWLYDPEELARVSSARRQKARHAPIQPGEMVARAFELFDDGRPLREVVTELRETPESIAAWHDQWLELGGAEIVVGPAARKELARLVGPFEGVADLVARVRDAVAPRAAEPATPGAQATDERGAPAGDA